ncbi:ATP-binding cassette domain-containing protein [Clostridium sp. BNL1100]|uniref:sulfate/molybdate ABC transporter ATP-binding protein n=1 Tax=Clostridium sp. BNL1100 TaxID=755731 RepID=UPI00024A7181|nr:ATP-binding cassette domain-containing protein [Clostridium sp. BNL1100]AEY66758.1 ABC-type sulfate/molybdate transport systems, ATPase component [Clostridium sp. BNL1100]
MALYVDIKKRLGKFNLEVQFNSQQGIMSLLGSSGSGKSMTLKCIAGIETPDEGRIVLKERVLFDSEKKINLPPQNRRVGYLFQNYALFPNMTVEENIGAGVKLPKKEKEIQVKEKIRMFFLEGMEKKRPSQLSGGQQQRVALARMLASEPDIIMLDEPFSALDSFLKWQLEQEIMETLSKFNGTVLLVSHNRNEVYRFSNDIAVITEGKIETVNKKEDLFNNPKTISSALLTGCKNISAVKRLSENSLLAIDWNITLFCNRKIPENIKYVGMRAHYFKYSEKNNGTNVMPCEVVKVIENPFSYIIMLKNRNKSSNENNSQIRWEVNKDIWKEICEKALPVNLFFPEDCLLLLTQ